MSRCRAPRLAAAVGALVLTLTATGCNAGGDADAESPYSLPSRVQSAAEHSLTSAPEDLAADQAEPLAAGDEPTALALPSDFPSQIPYVEGDVITATQSNTPSGTEWRVMLTTDLSTAEAAKQARARLLEAGFTTEGREGKITGDGTIFDTREYRLTPWLVTYTAIKGPDTATVSYVITIK
ncbi:hypothetical protein [Nocardioides limicola]|uniref:hypothetical protein n=1 Tax=Nocardioides limicola TaxID=2803368 RepID=UPI00193B5C06|nr:hypothetical protein [Nocardioides sp. DJM-14]